MSNVYKSIQHLTSLRSFYYWKQLSQQQTLISCLPASSHRSSVAEISSVPEMIPGLAPRFISFLSYGTDVPLCDHFSVFFQTLLLALWLLMFQPFELWVFGTSIKKLWRAFLNTDVNCIFQITFSALAFRLYYSSHWQIAAPRSPNLWFRKTEALVIPLHTKKRPVSNLSSELWACRVLQPLSIRNNN